MVTLVQACFALLQDPAIAASITMLVPDDHRDRANAILDTSGPLARIVSPVLAGMLYAVVGVVGVLLFDLLTFGIAVVVVARLHIPQPRQTAAGRAAQGSIWRELRGGFAFLFTYRGVLALTLYFTFLNFATEGIWKLMTPYLLTLTGSEAALGVLLGISSAGLVSGGLIAIVWRRSRPRIHTIMPAMMAAAVGLIVLALVRHPLALAATLFLMNLPYKLVNALLGSLYQLKIPPDMQGRVFAAMGQLALFAIPITHLITGPIVDVGLEPAVGSPGWSAVAPLVGSAPGSGMALYILVCGVALLLGTALTYALPAVRHIEHALPDYVAEVEAVSSAA